MRDGSLKSIACAGQGKFYELFEMDAHVGAEVLGLMYMRVRPSHDSSRLMQADHGAAAGTVIACCTQRQGHLMIRTSACCLHVVAGLSED